MADKCNPDLETGLSRLFRNPAFMRFQARGQRFRPMEALGIAHREKSHSDFLAFLLRPTESHGLNHSFLWDFLTLAGECEPAGVAHTRQLSLRNRLKPNLDRALVYRERYNIDLLVDCVPDGPVIGIEMKIWAGEQENQIPSYQEKLAYFYSQSRPRVLVFLTLDGREPSDLVSNNEVPVINLSWGEVIQILDGSEAGQVNDAIAPFVEAFRRNIEELTMTNTADKELLQTLFKNPETARLFRRIEKGRPRLKDNEVQKSLKEACSRKIEEITRSKAEILDNRDAGDDFVIWLRVEEWTRRGFPFRFAFYHQPSWESSDLPGFNVILAKEDLQDEDREKVQQLFSKGIPALSTNLEMLHGWNKKYQVIESPPDGKEIGWRISDESFDEAWISNAVALLTQQVRLIQNSLEKAGFL